MLVNVCTLGFREYLWSAYMVWVGVGCIVQDHRFG